MIARILIVAILLCNVSINKKSRTYGTSENYQVTFSISDPYRVHSVRIGIIGGSGWGFSRSLEKQSQKAFQKTGEK